MSKIFKSSSQASQVPAEAKEDPELTRLREQEKARAEADRTRATQDQLSLETRMRNRTRGMRSLFGVLGSGNRTTSLLGSG